MATAFFALLLATQSAFPPDPECIGHGSTPAACAELDRQAASAEKSLNSTYRLLLAKLEANGSNAFFAQAKVDLMAAQRAWVAFREKDCDARAGIYQGLGLLSGLGNTCRLDRARQRTGELQEMLDDLGALDEF